MTGDLRLDKWLFFARFTRTRAQASRLVAQGRVRINSRKTDKAHHLVRKGDVLTFPASGRIRVIRVLALAERRGASEIARTLYEDLVPA